MTIEFVIRLSGWLGIIINAGAIATTDTYLFLVGQVIAAISAALWSCYLQKKRVTLDLVLSLVLTVAAAITKEPFFMYSAMLVRSISYQFVFERVVKQNSVNSCSSTK